MHFKISSFEQKDRYWQQISSVRFNTLEARSFQNAAWSVKRLCNQVLLNSRRAYIRRWGTDRQKQKRQTLHGNALKLGILTAVGKTYDTISSVLLCRGLLL